jgi:thiol-disulfide isomerase/thioredoxin
MKLPVFLSLFVVIGLCVQAFDDDDDALNPIEINKRFLKIPELTDSSVGLLRKAVKNNQELVLFFHAEWCPSCQDYKPTFNLLHEFFKTHGISVYRINVENVELTTRFFIFTVPALFHIREGQVREVSKMRWKLVDYFEGKKWTEVEPWRAIRSPFGMVASIIGIATFYGQFISKEAGSLQWSKWKWLAVFFTCFALAWGPALYFSLFAKSRATGNGSDGVRKKND